MTLVYNSNCNIPYNTQISAKQGWARLNTVCWNGEGLKGTRKFSSSHESLSFPCLSDFVLKAFPYGFQKFRFFSLNNRFASTVFPRSGKYSSCTYFLLVNQWTASVLHKDKSVHAWMPPKCEVLMYFRCSYCIIKPI